MSLSPLICLALLAPIQTPPPQRFASTETHMGTKVEIVLYAGDHLAADTGFRAAFGRIAELDKIMSDYDADSELSRLSQASPTLQPQKVSRDLFHVLDEAQRLSRQSSGAFDVTVGPLTKLWRRARRQRELPRADLLAAARESVGYQYMQLDPEDSTVVLLRPAMRLDLGAIAKGYACDEALRELRRHGLGQALVDFSGNLACGDAPPMAPGWRVGIAPLDATSPPTRFLILAQCGVSTSGDTWQYVEIDGVRYSHILDPHTGLGLTNRSSVTVVAPSAILADGLSTTASVLGPSRGLELIETFPDAAALILQADGDQVRTFESRRVGNYLEVPNDRLNTQGDASVQKN